MAKSPNRSRVWIAGVIVLTVVVIGALVLFLGHSGVTAKVEPAIDPPPGSPFIAPGAGRSPIPEPGETFSAKLPPRRLDAGKSSPSSPIPIDMQEDQLPAGVIPWYAAPRCAGQEVMIQGSVVRTYNTGKVCFINFSPDRNVAFYLFMFASDFDQFPQPPEKFFLNKTVRVKGKVEPYGQKFEIVIRSKDQVEVVK